MAIGDAVFNLRVDKQWICLLEKRSETHRERIKYRKKDTPLGKPQGARCGCKRGKLADIMRAGLVRQRLLRGMVLSM
jgi:hypothetical protein